MRRIASYRISKNLWDRYARFLAAPRGGVFYGFFSLLLLSTFLLTAGFAQQVQPVVSSQLQEYISIGDNCNPFQPAMRAVYMEYYLLWSRTPQNPVGDPQGYWTGFV